MAGSAQRSLLVVGGEEFLRNSFVDRQRLAAAACPLILYSTSCNSADSKASLAYADTLIEIHLLVPSIPLRRYKEVAAHIYSLLTKLHVLGYILCLPSATWFLRAA